MCWISIVPVCIAMVLKLKKRLGTGKGAITKGVFSLLESLESLKSLKSLKFSRSLENGRILLCFPQSDGSLKSLEPLNSLESLEKWILSEKSPVPKDPLFRTRLLTFSEENMLRWGLSCWLGGLTLGALYTELVLRAWHPDLGDQIGALRETQIGNGRNIVSRALFRKRELTEFWANSLSSAKNSGSLPLQTNNRLRGTHWAFSPELGEGTKELTELGVWNCAFRNRIQAVSDQNFLESLGWSECQLGTKPRQDKWFHFHGCTGEKSHKSGLFR